MPSHRKTIFKKKKRERNSSIGYRRRRTGGGSGGQRQKGIATYFNEMAEALWNYICDYVPRESGIHVRDFNAPPRISTEEIKGIYGFHVKHGPADKLLEYELKCGEAGSREWYSKAMETFFEEGKHKEHIREI